MKKLNQTFPPIQFNLMLDGCIPVDDVVLDTKLKRLGKF